MPPGPDHQDRYGWRSHRRDSGWLPVPRQAAAASMALGLLVAMSLRDVRRYLNIRKM